MVLRPRMSPLLRGPYAVQAIAGPMKSFSYLLVPAQGMRMLRSGPGNGLLFELNPYWESPTWDGSYELNVQQVLQEKLKPGSDFYNVGVNIGFFTAFSRRCRVHKSSRSSQMFKTPSRMSAMCA